MPFGSALKRRICRSKFKCKSFRLGRLPTCERHWTAMLQKDNKHGGDNLLWQTKFGGGARLQQADHRQSAAGVKGRMLIRAKKL